MTNKKKNAIPIAEKSKNPKKEKVKRREEEVIDDFDFGGFPKDVDIKKNMGCGG